MHSYNPSLKIPGKSRVPISTLKTEFYDLQGKKNTKTPIIIFGPRTLLLKQHLNVSCTNEAKTYGMSIQVHMDFIGASKGAEIVPSKANTKSPFLTSTPSWNYSALTTWSFLFVWVTFLEPMCFTIPGREN